MNRSTTLESERLHYLAHGKQIGVHTIPTPFPLCLILFDGLLHVLRKPIADSSSPVSSK